MHLTIESSSVLRQASRPSEASVVALLAVRESALEVILILVGLGSAMFCYLLLVPLMGSTSGAFWTNMTSPGGESWCATTWEMSPFVRFVADSCDL